MGSTSSLTRLGTLRVRLAKSLAIALLVSGCSSVGTSAVRTGPQVLAPRVGAVYLYTPGRVPEGTQLGLVEVHASGSEATIDALTPIFVRKAASLGANAAVLEQVKSDFAFVSRPYIETYSFPCGFRTCMGSRMFAQTDEMMTVTLRGRALLVDTPAGEPRGAVEPAPASAPPSRSSEEERFP